VLVSIYYETVTSADSGDQRTGQPAGGIASQHHPALPLSAASTCTGTTAACCGRTSSGASLRSQSHGASSAAPPPDGGFPHRRTGVRPGVLARIIRRISPPRRHCAGPRAVKRARHIGPGLAPWLLPFSAPLISHRIESVFPGLGGLKAA
jgi:hypothetical protein